MYYPDAGNVYSNPFSSFRMAGFECTDQQNAFGNRVDFLSITGHIDRLQQDYALLGELGMRTVREGIRWSKVETKPYEYDWSGVDAIIEASVETSVQIVWDICHFGFPDDLTPLHPMFARRFGQICAAFVKHYRSLVPDGHLVVTPINEVSFLSWLGGDVRGTSPYCVGQGWEVKYMLMKAYIEGIELMLEVDPSVRIMTTEPLIHIAPANPSDTVSVINANIKHQEQFQVLDILSGKMCPELRGKPEYLDIIGLNFYFNNQWLNETHEFLPWGDFPPHPYWKPLSALVEETFLRYGRPIVISETSHPGEDRPKWLEMIGHECYSVLQQGLPLLGCCVYPIIDRPDWDFTDNWHRSGLWDIYDTVTLERIANRASIVSVKNFWPGK